MRLTLAICAGLLSAATNAPVLSAQRAATAADTVRLQVLWKVSSEEARDGEDFGILSGVVVDPSGNVYVADASAASIRVFDAKGQPLRSIGRKGKGPGEFTSPAGLGISTDGKLYVRDQTRYSRFRTDPSTKRLTLYDATIQRPALSDWTSTLPVKFKDTTTLYEPNLASFTRPPKNSGRYYRFTTGGKIVDTIVVPLFPTSPPPIAGWWVSKGSGRMAPGLNYPPFAAIPVWDLTSAGTLVSGNGDQYLLTERDESGKVLHTYQRSAAAEKIPARERADSLAALKKRLDTLPVPISRLEGVPPSVIRLELPQTFPFYCAVYSAADGKVWVRRWVRGSEKRTVFDVFEREGKFLTTVVLPISISTTVHPVLQLDRIVAVVVDAETGENMVYSFGRSNR